MNYFKPKRKREFVVQRRSIFQLFQVELDNFFKAEAALYEHWRLQPSEIERMPFFELESKLKILEEKLKERNKQEKEQKDKMGSGPKTPKMPNIKMPSIPKMK